MRATAMEQSVIQEALDNGGSIELDFGNPAHYKFFVGKLGGEDELERCFPTMYKTVRAQRAERMAEIKKETAVSRVSPGAAKLKKKDRQKSGKGPQDTVIIAPAQTFANAVPVRGGQAAEMNANSMMIAEFLEEKTAILSQTYILDNDMGEIYGIENKFYDNRARIVQPVQTNMIAKKRAELMSVAMVVYPQVTRGNATMNAKLTASAPATCILGEDVIKSFCVDHPKKRNGKAEDEIKVSYNRDHIIKDADYSISNWPDERNTISLKLPVAVSVEVGAGYRIKEIARLEGYKVYFQIPDGGMLYHMATYEDIDDEVEVYQDPEERKRNPQYVKGINISEDGKRITVTMPEDWKNRFDFSTLENKASVNLDIYGEFYFRIESDEIGSFKLPVSFFSYKEKGTESKASKRIKPLHFQWGCIAWDALITMQDGSKRRMDTLAIGDTVLGSGSTGMDIVNITKGTEPEILMITTAQRKSVRLTEDHTVFTVEKGAIPAGLLLAGMTIETEDGTETVASVERQVYEGYVYNLTFETSEAFYAGEIKVGDHEMQQNIRGYAPERAKEADSPQMKQLTQEFKELCRRMEEKNESLL